MPLSAYTWLGVGPLPVDPSPKVQEYVSGKPLGSDEPVPSNCTAVPSKPLTAGPAFATGGRLTTHTTPPRRPSPAPSASTALTGAGHIPPPASRRPGVHV